MVVTGFRFAPEDEKELDDIFEIISRIAEMSGAEVSVVTDVVRRGIAYNFRRESSPDGRPWPKLAEWTQAIRARGIDQRGVPFSVGAEHPILQRTGSLLKSFTDENNPYYDEQSLSTPDKTYISVGARDTPETPGRIELLHEGGVVVTGKGGAVETKKFIIPPRPWIGLSTGYQRELFSKIFKILDEHLELVVSSGARTPPPVRM